MPPAGETTNLPTPLLENPAVVWAGTFSNADWASRQGVSVDGGQVPSHGVRFAPPYTFPTPYVLRVEHETLSSNWESGFTAKAWLSSMGITGMPLGTGTRAGFDELYLSYYLWYESDFVFVQAGTGVHSGKEPGLAGMSVTSLDFPGGGNCTSETDSGWSMRGMYNEFVDQPNRARHTLYAYADNTCSGANHGNGYKTSNPYRVREHLYHITIRVKRNTSVGAADGIAQMYARDLTATGTDDYPTLVLSLTDVRYRHGGTDAPINIYAMHLFPGGSDRPPGHVHYGMPVLSTALLPSYAFWTPGSDPPPDPDPPDEPDPPDPPDDFPAEDHYRNYVDGARVANTGSNRVYVPGGRPETGGRF